MEGVMLQRTARGAVRLGKVVCVHVPIFLTAAREEEEEGEKNGRRLYLKAAKHLTDLTAIQSWMCQKPLVICKTAENILSKTLLIMPLKERGEAFGLFHITYVFYAVRQVSI